MSFIRGLYFWDTLDSAINEVFSSSHDVRNFILFWAGSAGMEWAYPPEYENGKSVDTYPVDERYRIKFVYLCKFAQEGG